MLPEAVATSGIFIGRRESQRQLSPSGENRRSHSSSRVTKFLQFETYDTTWPVTSYFVSPRGLFLWRAFAATLSFGILMWSMIRAINGGQWFAFFTNLGYLSLAVYFMMATFMSWKFLRTQEEACVHPETAVISPVPWTIIFFHILYTVVMCNHFLIVAIFWTLLTNTLYADTTAGVVLSVFTHAINFVMIVTEFLLCRMPIFASHSSIVIGIIVLYTFWVWTATEIWVTETGERFWVYDFLDYNASGAAMWYIAIFVAVCLLFVVVYWLHRLRDKRAAASRKQYKRLSCSRPSTPTTKATP